MPELSILSHPSAHRSASRFLMARRTEDFVATFVATFVGLAIVRQSWRRRLRQRSGIGAFGTSSMKYELRPSTFAPRPSRPPCRMAPEVYRTADTLGPEGQGHPHLAFNFRPHLPRSIQDRAHAGQLDRSVGGCDRRRRCLHEDGQHARQREPSFLSRRAFALRRKRAASYKGLARPRPNGGNRKNLVGF